MAGKKELKRGLGTGLGVLFGEDDFSGNETDIQTLPLGHIEPRKGQPRIRFNEEAIEELADSIKTYGLIQPITVRNIGDGYYQIIAGERRWRACKLAGLTEVPVRIIEADDRLTAELALVENLQREDLNPIEEAKGFKALIEEYGLTQEEASKSVGKSRTAVTNSLRLLDLCPKVLSLVEEGALTAGHAKVIVSLKSPDLQLQAAESVISKGLSVRQTEKLVQEMQRPAKEPEKRVEIDYAKEVSDALTRAIGYKVCLHEGKKGGKFEISYSSADEREAIIKLLSK